MNDVGASSYLLLALFIAQVPTVRDGNCELVHLTAAGALGNFEQANAGFGEAVDLEETTAVVGAGFEDTGGVDRGAVYVYRQAGSAWVQTQRIAPTVANSAVFGRQVAVSRDLEWICVAQQTNVGGGGTGALWFYRLNVGSGQYQHFETIGGFGNSDFEGDNQPSLDFGDGSDYLILGTPGDGIALPLGDTEDGSAYVFRFDGTTWGTSVEALHIGSGLIATLIPDSGDKFGWSVALVGSPPNQSALVGSPGWSKSGSSVRKGAVYWFRQIGTNAFTWRNIGPNGVIEVCDVSPCADGYDGSTDAEFGRDVDVSFDELHVMVGAQNYEDSGDPDQAGKLFELTDDQVGIAPETFFVDRVLRDDELATSQAFAGQLEMRIAGTLLVGELGDDANGTNRGAVHVFKSSGGTWYHAATVRPPVAELPAQGASDFISGAFRIGMGRRYAIIGAIGGVNGGGTRVGGAWILDHGACPGFARRRL